MHLHLSEILLLAGVAAVSPAASVTMEISGTPRNFGTVTPAYGEFDISTNGEATVFNLQLSTFDDGNAAVSLGDGHRVFFENCQIVLDEKTVTTATEVPFAYAAPSTNWSTIAYRVIDADVVVSDAIAAVMDRNDGNWYGKAVCDLTNGIARTTGRCPSVYAESAVPSPAPKAAIYVGDTTAGAAYRDASMRALDFRIVTVKKATYIRAATSTAVSYGVGEYLRRVCDYWFVTVLGDDPAVSNSEAVALPGEFAPRPKTYYRYLENGMYDGGKYPTTKCRWEEWNRRTRLESKNDEIEPSQRFSWSCGKDCHTSFLYCPPATYFPSHPEYYSQIPGGGRQYTPYGQLCYSNSDVKDIVYNSLVAYIQSDRAGKAEGDWPTIYDFSQEDNTSFICRCSDCLNLIAQYTNSADPSESAAGYNGGDCGLVLSLVNDVARRIAADYPDAVIRPFAYVSTETPPKEGTIVPETNVLIRLCDLYSQCCHELPLTHAFNAAAGRDQLIRDWTRLAKRVELWDYMLYGRDFPEPNVDAIAADAKFFADNGLDRYFMESEYADQPFWELNMFLAGELMYNPDLSVENLVGKYCRVYGAGAEDMVSAIAYLRAEMQANPPKSMPDWHARILPWLCVDTMAEFRTRCETAYAKEPVENIARSRIAKVLAATCRKQMALYRSLVGKETELEEATEAYRKYAKENARWTIMEETSRAGQDAAIDAWIDRQNLWFDDLPEEFQTMARADVHCIDSANFEGEGTVKYVTDSAAYGGRGLFHSHSSRTIPCGLYDRSSTAETSMTITLPSGDMDTSSYVWRKVGVGQIGSNTIVWLPGDWYMSVYVWEYFVNCDGATKDLNWYEFWVSMRVQGPSFNASDTERESGFMFDRWAMRRVDAP